MPTKTIVVNNWYCLRQIRHDISDFFNNSVLKRKNVQISSAANHRGLKHSVNENELMTTKTMKHLQTEPAVNIQINTGENGTYCKCIQ